MWFGLLYGISDDAPADAGREDDAHAAGCGPADAPAGDERAMVVLYAWEVGRARPLTVGCPLSAVPDMARWLRQAMLGWGIRSPRCDACGTTLDLPLE